MPTHPHPPNSFNEFADRWRPDLLAAARRVLGDSDLVDDVVQTVLLKLLIAGKWQSIEAPRAYLRSAVHREALRADAFRRRSVPLTDAGNALRSNASDPLQRTMILEQGALLRAHLARLPERCGLIMRLMLVEGLSQGEIARRLQISRGAVEKQVARAREHLRRWLKVGAEGAAEWCPQFRTGG